MCPQYCGFKKGEKVTYLGTMSLMSEDGGCGEEVRHFQPCV